jgi:uncharacterized cupredoxin-like copper-binding protein
MKSSIALGAVGLAMAATVGAQQPQAHHSSAMNRPAAAIPYSSIGLRKDGIRTVTVTAADYSFTVPDTIPAGLTEIRLLNRGTEMHHVFLIRLDGGKAMSDLFAEMRGDGPLPSWAKEVGGPNTPGPGGDATAIVRLKAGRYAMICVIPSKDGTPHVMKGMAKEITVTPATSNTSSANIRIASTVTLVDYGFKFSQPLQTGRQTIRVVNQAAQSHELVLVRLQPGKSPADVLAWMEKMDGPPPGAPIGGVTPMAQGEENLLEFNLTAGDYGLICFVPDAKDGKAHFAHGMVSTFTLR